MILQPSILAHSAPIPILPTPCLPSYSYYSPIAFDTDSDSDSDSDSNDFYSKSNLNSAMPSNLMSCTSLLIPTLESDLDFNLPNLHSRLDKLDRLIDSLLMTQTFTLPGNQIIKKQLRTFSLFLFPFS